MTPHAFNSISMQRKPIQISTPGDAAALYHQVWDQTVNGGDVYEALGSVANAMGYAFDPVLLDVADLSLGELQKIGRFKGNPNIADSRKGNTAQHVLQGTLVACYDLVDEFREFLVSPHLMGQRAEAVAPIDEMVRYVPNVMDSVFLEYLSHDDGEKLFEPASLTQNVTENMRKSWPILERRIAYFGLVLALYAHERYANRTEKKKFYGDVFDKIRKPAQEYYERMTAELKQGKVDEKTFADVVTKHIIMNFIKPQEEEYRLSMVEVRYQAFADHYLSRYDEPEGFGRAGGFSGLYTKVGQKNHSVMHINEHHGKDGGIPHELTTSLLTVASLGYAEKMLPTLFNAVGGGNSVHTRMALRAAQRVYSTNLAMAGMMPPVIDISKKRGEEQPAGSPGRMAEIGDLLTQVCLPLLQSGQAADISMLNRLSARETPGSLRTAFQLRARYEAALQEVRNNPYFQPPAQPFYELEKVDGAVGDRIDRISLAAMPLYPGPTPDNLEDFIRNRWAGIRPA